MSPACGLTIVSVLLGIYQRDGSHVKYDVTRLWFDHHICAARNPPKGSHVKYNITRLWFDHHVCQESTKGMEVV